MADIAMTGMEPNLVLKKSVKKILFFGILSVALATIVTISVRNTVSDVLLASVHSEGEDRLLSYISDIRRVLGRYRVLPYLTSDNDSINQLLLGDPAAERESEAFLTHMDKAANTRGWYVFRSDGSLASASIEDYPDNKMLSSLFQRLEDSGGEVVTATDTTSTPVFHYFAAPLYGEGKLAGLSVIRFELNQLEESWSAANEHVFVSDMDGKFFLRVREDLPINLSSSVTQQRVELSGGYSISIMTLVDSNKSFLEQSVLLDDVNWRVYFLTPLDTIHAYANGSAAIALTLTVSLIALCLYLNERKRRLRTREQFQLAITDSEQQLRQIITGTNVGLIMLDRWGETLFINPMAQRYLTLSDSEARGFSLNQLFPDDERNEIINALLERLKDSDFVEMTGVEAHAQRSDGSTFPILFSITASPQASQKVYLVTILDISKRKKAEHALQELNSRLEQRVLERTAELESAKQTLIDQQKLAAMGKMSTAIVHELNQPLTGLKTLLSSNSLLIERQQMDTLRTNMAMVDTLIDRMAAMTSQLKTFAFNRPSELLPLSIYTLIDRVVLINQDRLERVMFSRKIEYGIPLIKGEAQRVEQAIGNLLSNAMDAVEGVKEPMIELKVKLKVCSDTKQKYVNLDVIDNGPGVSDQELGQIFEPFYTSKKMGEGLGIGLAITANSMRDIGGSIEAFRNNGQGMTFRLQFDVFSK
ncbi:sensor histidine kinase [Veronia pacifica]|uniref:sensor histidine kinase n=1 Tax=Veronia pacifica TaxID=1080227 RepID=UPI0009F61E1B|nr:ATP-binding protein [Veronia pacifica]